MSKSNCFRNTERDISLLGGVLTGLSDKSLITPGGKGLVNIERNNLPKPMFYIVVKQNKKGIG